MALYVDTVQKTDKHDITWFAQINTLVLMTADRLTSHWFPYVYIPKTFCLKRVKKCTSVKKIKIVSPNTQVARHDVIRVIMEILCNVLCKCLFLKLNLGLQCESKISFLKIIRRFNNLKDT